MNEYLIVEKMGIGEIVEKKSRFIAHVLPIETEEQALAHIEAIKKKYWDARHNCFAFVIGKNNEIQRFSDDGEPQGTAGKPILEVLTAGNIHNALIVVTRYFGGTLLGTGGLVRAYGQSAREGVNNAVVKKVSPGIRIEVVTDYNSIGKLKYIVGQMDINTIEEIYEADVRVILEMKEEDIGTFKSKITDATNGKAQFENEKEVDFKQEV